ncbi:hypothetical protein [Pseudarthrobacter sp. Y6]|uniref:hypothetical protein n=1 Tax=Pseudarthrobacter sp. Y6 TaxID=3418422 RepID=UPI003CF710F2
MPQPTRALRQSIDDVLPGPGSLGYSKNPAAVTPRGSSGDSRMDRLTKGRVKGRGSAAAFAQGLHRVLSPMAAPPHAQSSERLRGRSALPTVF